VVDEDGVFLTKHPQLDTCDPSQPFGVKILMLSTDSFRIRNAVLALADASLHEDRISQLQRLTDNNRGASNVRDPIETAVLGAFRVLRDVVIDLAGFWRQHGEAAHGTHLLSSILHFSRTDLWLAPSVYWTLVRLSK
jgi:hypothetical protein